MSWTDRIIFFGAGYIVGISGYNPPSPLMHMSPEGLKFLGYQVAEIREGKIRIGNIDILEIKQ